MYKKFLILMVGLIFGLLLGLFGRSAPDAQTADFGKVAKATASTQTTAAEITTEPKANEKTPAAEYTEITVTATAYCSCAKCCGKTDGITATGTKATAGRTIAVDPSVIPYGTKVIINGNTYVAEDCGGAVKGNDIDIFFNSHKEAQNFGRKILTAYILN